MRKLRQAVPALMLLAVAAGGIFSSARAAQGQSVLERTPNLAAGWTGTEGTVYFNFLHRFWKVDTTTESKILNSPTFFLALPLPGRTLLGVDYSSNSLVDGGELNEYEFFARWTPVSTAAGHPIDLSFTGAFNEAASSGDVEVMAAIPRRTGEAHGGRAVPVGCLRRRARRIEVGHRWRSDDPCLGQSGPGGRRGGPHRP